MNLPILKSKSSSKDSQIEGMEAKGTRETCLNVKEEAITGLSVLCLLVGPGVGDLPVSDRHQTLVPVVMAISEN